MVAGMNISSNEKSLMRRERKKIANQAAIFGSFTGDEAMTQGLVNHCKGGRCKKALRCCSKAQKWPECSSCTPANYFHHGCRRKPCMDRIQRVCPDNFHRHKRCYRQLFNIYWRKNGLLQEALSNTSSDMVTKNEGALALERSEQQAALHDLE